MAIKLDDFLSKKKEVAPILDLSKCTANSKEELKKLLEKVPEFRMRPEKIKPEDIKIREKDFTFKTPKRELKPTREYQFVDPVPTEMRGVRLEDLSSVNIPWKMLTTLRPKNKMEDEFFSRLVELGKLRLQTEEREKRISSSDFVRKMKSKAGIVETRVVSCRECGEEFCSGEACTEFLYEAFVREDPAAAAAAAAAAAGKGGGDEEGGRGRSRKKKRRGKSKVLMGGGAPTASLARDKSRSKSKATKERRKSKSREGRKSGSRGRKSSKSRDRKSSKSGERKSGDRTKKKVRKKKKKKKVSTKELQEGESSDLE